jgi:hypothetical protein
LHSRGATSSRTAVVSAATAIAASTLAIVDAACQRDGTTVAHEFYVNYLGFTIDWEHQFDGQGPTYTQISRGTLVLHLSEHYGDGTPGSACLNLLDPFGNTLRIDERTTD